MPDSAGSRGLVFLSHSHKDKDVVEAVLAAAPKSHVFYDIRIMEPGASTVDEMERGIEGALVFAMFVSPNISRELWVQYEGALAKIEKIRRPILKIIAIPIKGATYANAPEWMQRYFATNEHYSPRDIARTLQSLFEQALHTTGVLPKLPYAGREGTENHIIREIRTKPGQTGVSLNVVILSGIQGMGRLTLADHLLAKIFPGMRDIHPVFELPRQADAKDFFLALRSDAEGKLSEQRVIELAAAMPDNDPNSAAELIHANLDHFAKLNQPIIVKCARSLRDVGPHAQLKPWVNELFRLLTKTPDVKLVWISELSLPAAELQRHKNILQFAVGQIEPDSIFYILCELLGVRDTSPMPLLEISSRINGHAATAHYVAEVIRNGMRSPEAIIADPKFIVAYQQQFVEDLLERKALGDTKFSILQLLAILPSLDFDALADALASVSQREIVHTLDELTEVGLVSYSMNLQYRVPEIVRSVFLIKHPTINTRLLRAVADILGGRIADNSLTIQSVNALVFANVLLKDRIPDAFKGVITQATLHDLVYEQYQLGLRFEKEFRKHFESAAKLAEVADVIPTDNDAYETVLFYAADGLIRIGGDPTPFIAKLERRGLAAALYLRGSYAYHVKRDPKEAIKNLRIAFERGTFRGRTATLLSKVYYATNDTTRALEVFDSLGEERVKRNSGMLAQMIRCLRIAGRRDDAERLTKELSRLPDDYGQYEMMQAALFFRNRKFVEALGWIEKAKLKPRVDRVNLTLLETSVKIENHDFSPLDETVNLAIGVGRSDDALSLRARAALLGAGGWREAEQQLRKISKMNFFDKVLLLRTLIIKCEDPEIKADPTVSATVRREIDALTLETKSTPEDFER